MCCSFCGETSSDFDLIGPYFTSNSGLDSRFTLACLYETMQSLESVGFKIKALVCDGASWNLAMVKKLCEIPQSMQEDSEEDSDSDQESDPTPPCSFKNPFSNEQCWIVNCPSHQVCFIIPLIEPGALLVVLHIINVTMFLYYTCICIKI